MPEKTKKELAFLDDLYLATDWGERFAELIDQHIEVPAKGRALYIEAGTGGHALAVQQRAGAKLELVCADQNEESVEVARVKAAALKEPTQFKYENSLALTFSDDQFDLVLANGSFTARKDLQRALSEMVRVTKPGGRIAWWLPTAGSFGEFFSIYWEALLGAGINDRGVDVEHLITDLPTASDVEAWAADAGVEDIQSWTQIEEFNFESGEQFLNSPLIMDFLLPSWLQTIPAPAREQVITELSRIIDEERHSGQFALTLKATLLMGKKGLVQ